MSEHDLRALRRGSLSHAGPAVPRPPTRWVTRVLIPAAILVTTAGALAFAARDTLRNATRVTVVAVVPKPLDVAAAGAVPDVATGDQQGVVLSQAPGWVEPDPFATTVAALAEGVVREVAVFEGQTIAEGDVVARLVDDDAKLALRGAQAKMAMIEAEVDAAASAIVEAEAQVAVQKALADELRDDIDRKRDLVATGIGAGEFRRLELRLEGAVASITGAEQVVIERRAALQRTRAALAEAQVAMDEAQLRLSRMTITSPVSGVVLARLVQTGSRLGGVARFGQEGMESSVIRVYDPAQLQVRVDVPIADAGKVGLGTPATVTTEALPDVVMRGVVTRVVHEANIQRNTVQFKVRLEDPPSVLKPEMLTRVKFHGAGVGAGRVDSAGAGLGPTHLSLLIPVQALHNRRDGAAEVWITEARDGGIVARRREITMSESADEGYVLVGSGLRITDKVVIDAPASLKDGERIVIAVTEKATHDGVAETKR